MIEVLERLPRMRRAPLSHPDYSLIESREKYRALFESNMIGIAVSDLNDTILETNDAFLDIIGYTREEFEQGAVTWSIITPVSYAAVDRKKVRELLRHGVIKPFEKRYAHKKGHEVSVLVGAARIQNDPPLSVCFALDISQLKKLEQKKDEFIGTVSHELQTPLAVLKMQVGLLRDQLASGVSVAAIERSVGEIGEQVDRLSMLVTDFLNLARYAGDTGTVRREVFNICACVEKVVTDARLISRRQIIFKKGRSDCLVLGSERQIIQVITNILMNALRYSPGESRVTVSVRTEAGMARVAIRDFGVGIPKDKLSKVFERFYRVEHANEYARGSSGIGLYVANEIAKAGGGTIKVTSALGKGSTFTCVLPLAK